MQRIKYFDVAKGILIILLLFHHFESVLGRTDIKCPYLWHMVFWQPLFTTFFMQCFFIISGYCSNFNKGSKCFYLSLFRQLIIPLIVFEIVGNICTLIVRGNFTWDCFIQPYINAPNTSLWFIIALIVAKLFIYNARKLCNQFVLIAISLGLLILGIYLYQFKITENILSYQNSLGSVLFVSIGYVLKNRQSLYNNILRYSSFVFPILITILYVLHFDKPIFTAKIGVSVDTIPLFILVSTTGSFAFLNLCKTINNCNTIEYIGRNSLIVYALHFPSLYIILKTMLGGANCPRNLFQFLIYIFIAYTLELFCCLLWIKVINYKYFKWMIGK